jgi:NAD-dependent deacetylase
MDEVCELGSPLRPHVVWFGEPVPMIETAAALCQTADIFMLIGISLAVYPAAGLIDFVHADVLKYIIDPHIPAVRNSRLVYKIEEKATVGVPGLVEELMGNSPS